MSQDRILGSSARVAINTPGGPIPIAEFDKFSATQDHTELSRQPLGQVGQDKQIIYGGYNLSFEVPHLDESVFVFFAAQDALLLAGLAVPRYVVTEVIQYMDGHTAERFFTDAIIYGLDTAIQSAKDEIKNSFKGYSRICVPTL